MKTWSYQQIVESRLRQPGRQLSPLQPSLTLPHVEHSDGANRILQPASFALLQPGLHIQLRVRGRVSVITGPVVGWRPHAVEPQRLGQVESKNGLPPQGAWRGLAVDEGGGAGIVLQGNDIAVGHQEVFQLILELEDGEIGKFFRRKIAERLLIFQDSRWVSTPGLL